MEIFDRNKYKFSNVPSLVEVSDEINKARANEIDSIEKELYSYRILIQDLRRFIKKLNSRVIL